MIFFGLTGLLLMVLLGLTSVPAIGNCYSSIDYSPASLSLILSCEDVIQS